jgi:hypothetical protein
VRRASLQVGRAPDARTKASVAALSYETGANEENVRTPMRTPADRGRNRPTKKPLQDRRKSRSGLDLSMVPGKGFEPPLPKRELGPQRSASPLWRKDLRPRLVHVVHGVHRVPKEA